MSTSIRIEGLTDALKALDKLPANAVKMTEKAMTEAAKPVVRKIRAGMPKEFRRLIKYKLVKGERRISGNSAVIIGAFKGKKISDKDVPQWFKAYWSNYGTLTHRDPGHEFVYPVKKATKSRRNNVGQTHRNFFDEAFKGWEDIIYENFVAALKKREDELLK